MSHKLFRLFFVLTLVIGLIVVPTPQSARAAGSLYVTPSGNDNNNCVSTGTPCATINGALNNPSFVAGDTILVAIGIYTGTSTEVTLLDKNVTLSGGWDDTFTSQSGMSTIDGQGARRGITVNSNVIANVENIIVQNGFNSDQGAGIFNIGILTITNSIIRANRTSLGYPSGEGGGIWNGWDGFNSDSGTLTLNNTSVISNVADRGAGISNRQNSSDSNQGGNVTLNHSMIRNNTASAGGGIFSSSSYAIFELTLNNSTVSGNTASGYDGGGIWFDGKLTLNNSTVSSNNAQGDGGGIYNGNQFVSFLNNSTVSANTANGSGGGVFDPYGAMSIENSLIAGNTATTGGPDCRGSINSADYNLIGDTSGCTVTPAPNDQFNANPQLGTFLPIQGYHPLLVASPAINAGNPATCFQIDQRGVSRVGTCDIGAYEYTTPGSATSLSVVSGSGQLVETTFAFSNPLQAAALDGQGSPVGGVTIDFTAPASGPSGTFADLGTNTTSVDTDATGVATTSTFTANDQAGAFMVVASAPGLGSVNFDLEQWAPPGNDNFAGADAIPSLPFNTTVDITNATNAGEPGPCYSFMERTVWYSFSPTETSGVSVSTQGGASNRNVNIYRAAGPDISDLTFLDCAIENESATFVAEFGKTYYLQVGSVFDQVGTIELNLEPIPSPENDNFINAEPVSLPLPFDHFVDLTAASSQEGEPIPSCASFGLNGTVWYAFTPAQSGAVSARINNATEYTQLAAYSGSSLGDLTELGCNAPFGGVVSLLVEAGTTYYFQAGNFVSTQSGSMQFHLEVTPLPVADFYYYPGDPSKFDTIQFQDSSYDPGLFGIQTYQWNFGDGAVASGYSAAHKYAKDGDYVVTHTVTTIDGRTASFTRTVQIRTHDVAITKITTPNSANVGQTKTITVNLRNIAYPETVQVDLFKSTPSGFVWVATVTKLVPALSGNRTTAFDFSYKFMSDDAKVGKVTFKAVATITSARDAWPSDNEIFSSQTKVAK